jgi:hypothetical protein
LLKGDFARKNKLGEKAQTKLAETFAKTLKSILATQLCRK